MKKILIVVCIAYPFFTQSMENNPKDPKTEESHCSLEHIPKDLWPHIVQEPIVNNSLIELASIQLRRLREVNRMLRDYLDHPTTVIQLVNKCVATFPNIKTHTYCADRFPTPAFKQYKQINDVLRIYLFPTGCGQINISEYYEQTWFDMHYSFQIHNKWGGTACLLSGIIGSLNSSTESDITNMNNFIKKIPTLNTLCDFLSIFRSQSYEAEKCTLLEIALNNSHKVAEALLLNKADVDTKDSDNNTLLEKVLSNQKGEKENYNIVQFLLQQNADINQSPTALKIVSDKADHPLKLLLHQHNKNHYTKEKNCT